MKLEPKTRFAILERTSIFRLNILKWLVIYCYQVVMNLLSYDIINKKG